MLALTSNQAYADAYGTVASPPYNADHLLITIKGGHAITDVAPAEVTFDPADIEGTFLVDGHPGVIGLWLATFSTRARIADPTAIDPTGYVVTDLRPTDNGYMFRRGEVWPPWDGVSRPIAREHPYP